jgi:hypothetical protein
MGVVWVPMALDAMPVVPPNQAAVNAGSLLRMVQTLILPGIEVFKPTIDIPFWH